MRKGFLYVLATLVIGCGSGNSNPAPGNTTEQQCLPSAACVACVAGSCNSQAVAAFGSGYATGNYNGGQCPNLMTCSCATGSTNGGMSTCAGQDGANCATAFDALNSCMNAASCGVACKTGNSGGGNTGTGTGTTTTTGLACPLGTWIADLGPSGCPSGARTAAKMVVTESLPGQYVVTSVMGPYLKNDPLTGQTCNTMSQASASTTYANGLFVITLPADTTTCSHKLITTTMVINPDCTQAETTTVFDGCLKCDNGNCSGCGTINSCGAPSIISVRSAP